ncbi:putative General transcription factor IIF subunit 2 [Hypsibius exemplaris]|uniref:General transcription factor IIF subunit 2 n=1 Tax=Hypsibius exemplaris TaxID=2072580 RepID=A0A9X6NA86_HYPEX|nr:putative General transcription factor IIF subunit 2 [Hypsibius exemplaris]
MSSSQSSSQSTAPAAPATAAVAIESQKLECSNSSRPVWLVKVPKYLAQAFEKATQEDVGQLSITKAAGKVEIKMKVKRSILPDDTIPTSYDVPLTIFASQKMAVMAKTGDSGALVMDGFVNRRADIRPAGAGGTEYMKMKQAQIKKAGEPVRTVIQLVDRVNNYKPIDNASLKRGPSGSGSSAPPKPEKRLRGDKERVTEAVFAAFEKHQYYTLHDLVEQLNQPASFLKQDILKEFCDYNSKGPHKNTYELKPEYRHYTKAT